MTWQSETRAWALASAGVFCLFSIGYRVWTAPKLPDLNPTVAHIDAATKSWSDASAQQVTSVSAIEKDIRAQLWHVDRVLNSGSDTLKAATGTLQASTRALDTANDQLTHVAPVLDAAKGSLDAIPPAITQITKDVPPLIANANGAVTDVRKFITSPDLMATVGNVEGITEHTEGMSADFQHALHPILNPEPCKTKGCKVKRTFKAILGATTAGEGAYYTLQILKELF